LPDAKKTRFMAEYSLSPYDASVLVAERETADFFESAVNHDGMKRDAKAVANWLMGDLAAHANAQGVPVAEAGLSAASLATLVDLIAEGVISGKIAKDLLVMLLGDDRGAELRALVEARGLRQVTDSGVIDHAVDAVIAANPDKAEQAKSKPGMLGWFVGQVMKSTGGKANPQAVSDALKRRLGI
jgi:aspartyl-tRNA(Asn)/glutamyl-tRNA(Gln) amidotransferase subunit B